MAAWTTDYLLLEEEFIQRKDEGVVVPQALQSRFDALKADDGSGTNSDLGTVYAKVRRNICR